MRESRIEMIVTSVESDSGITLSGPTQARVTATSDRIDGTERIELTVPIAQQPRVGDRLAVQIVPEVKE